MLNTPTALGGMVVAPHHLAAGDQGRLKALEAALGQ